MNLTVKEILEDLHAAERDCQVFEQKYGVLSEYFYTAYMNGSLEDTGNPDFALWAGACEIKQNREEPIAIWCWYDLPCFPTCRT